MSETGTDQTEAGAAFWGACGVEACDECFPLFDDANEPITDNLGRLL